MKKFLCHLKLVETFKSSLSKNILFRRMKSYTFSVKIGSTVFKLLRELILFGEKEH